jgi:hypothetical protein
LVAREAVPDLVATAMITIELPLLTKAGVSQHRDIRQ